MSCDSRKCLQKINWKRTHSYVTVSSTAVREPVRFQSEKVSLRDFQYEYKRQLFTFRFPKLEKLNRAAKPSRTYNNAVGESSYQSTWRIIAIARYLLPSNVGCDVDFAERWLYSVCRRFMDGRATFFETNPGIFVVLVFTVPETPCRHRTFGTEKSYVLAD